MWSLVWELRDNEAGLSARCDFILHGSEVNRSSLKEQSGRCKPWSGWSCCEGNLVIEVRTNKAAEKYYLQLSVLDSLSLEPFLHCIA